LAEVHEKKFFEAVAGFGELIVSFACEYECNAAGHECHAAAKKGAGWNSAEKPLGHGHVACEA
jgi:hypothetical protein